jgi:hypothetical protein
MNVIDPYIITETTLTDTNVTEDDYGEWDVSTTYDANDRVIVAGTVHKIYQSVAGGNLGNAPSYTTASNDYWIYVGATNRWKTFDNRTDDPVSKVTPITYQVTDPRIVTDIAFFRVSKATEVTITVTDPDVVEIFNGTFSLIDTSHMTDWLLFFTEEPRYVRQKIVSGLPAVAGSKIDLELSGPSGETIGVGQICFGRAVHIGETLTGTEPGYVSYSRKERDSFGNAILNPRGFKRRVSYVAAVDPKRVDNIIEDLANLDAKGAVYFADNDIDFYGCTVFGLVEQFGVPQGIGVSFLQVEVQSL